MAPPVARAKPQRNPENIDASEIREDIPYATSFAFVDFKEEGVKAPKLKNADGSLRLVDAWAKELKGSPMQILAQVSRALSRGKGDAYDYKKTSSLDNVRITTNQGLAQGGGDCAWFSVLGSQALVASGAFKKEDVVVAGTYGTGGWHTVIVVRNPETGKWDVIDYQRHVKVSANSPGAATSAYFKNHGLGVVYQQFDPDGDAHVLYRVNSEQRAELAKISAGPGFGNKKYGMVGGLNEGVIGAPKSVAAPSPVTNTAALGVGPAQVGVQLAPDGSFDDATVSVLQERDDGSHGVKGLLSRDPDGSGTNVFLGGEWWHITPGAYFGIVGGAQLRIQTDSPRLKGAKETSIAPLVAVQGGTRADLAGSAEDSYQLTGYWNSALRVVAPFVLNEDARKAIDKSANGNGPGGLIDPSVLGLADLRTNAGLAYRVRIFDGLSFYSNATLRGDVADPTLLKSPLDYIGLSLDTHLSYTSDDFDATIGAAAQKGLYDRDAAWNVYGSIGTTVAPGVILGANLSAGQYQNGNTFVQTGVGVTAPHVQVGAGTVIEESDAGVSARPNLGLQLSF